MLWSIALIVDYLGVGIGWRVPGRPPVPQEHLRGPGGHFARRHQQICVIAVGEQLVGPTMTDTRPSGVSVLDHNRTNANMSERVSPAEYRAAFRPPWWPAGTTYDSGPRSVAQSWRVTLDGGRLT
jgi:hypothetical protein